VSNLGTAELEKAEDGAPVVGWAGPDIVQEEMEKEKSEDEYNEREKKGTFGTRKLVVQGGPW
jgi:hypothetical protein